MTRNFTWTDAKRQAVDLTAQGDFSQQEVATRVGTTIRTLQGWMRRPAVRAEIEPRRRAVLEAYLAPPSPAQRAALAHVEAELQAEAEAWVAGHMAHYRAYRKRQTLAQETHDVA
jgi:hypothetical protein